MGLEVMGKDKKKGMEQAYIVVHGNLENVELNKPKQLIRLDLCSGEVNAQNQNHVMLQLERPTSQLEKHKMESSSILKLINVILEVKWVLKVERFSVSSSVIVFLQSVSLHVAFEVVFEWKLTSFRQNSGCQLLARCVRPYERGRERI
ncbi:hypothetical protein K1719_018809 [Acacia pycnantha]|nr:hypothetical protein K1719_018809 [Acacia pycnantha]